MFKIKINQILSHIRANPTLLMITGSIIGFILTLFIFFYENIPYIPRNALIIRSEQHIVKTTKYIFNDFPDFFVWIMIFTLHTSAAIALGLSAAAKVYTLKKYQIGRRELIISLGLVILMIFISSTSYIIPFNSGNYFNWPVVPLNHMWEKIIILLAISIVAAGINVLGLILMGCVCVNLKNTSQLNNDIELYLEIKETIENFLQITGYILSSGMITVYFFMASQAAFKTPKTFSIQALALFGLLFTIFIAVTFILTRLLLTEYGRSIVDQKLGTLPRRKNEIKEWIATRDSMEKYLQLKFDIVENLR